MEKCEKSAEFLFYNRAVLLYNHSVAVKYRKDLNE